MSSTSATHDDAAVFMAYRDRADALLLPLAACAICVFGSSKPSFWHIVSGATQHISSAFKSLSLRSSLRPARLFANLIGQSELTPPNGVR